MFFVLYAAPKTKNEGHNQQKTVLFWVTLYYIQNKIFFRLHIRIQALFRHAFCSPKIVFIKHF